MRNEAGNAVGILAGLVSLGLASLWLAGCGYVGEPLPPALKRPVRVTDLAAVERGSKLVIQFTVPQVTTENLAIQGDPDIELRVGPVGPQGFNQAQWAHDSERVADVPQVSKGHARAEVAAAKYYGKSVVVGVNIHGPGGRTAGWSNFVSLPVIQALASPLNLAATDVPDAIRLEWRGAAPEFRVFRKLVADAAFAQLAVSAGQAYTDTAVEYGKTYQYVVQAIARTGDVYAESEPSDTLTVKPVDKFPPAAPAGLTAVPSTRSIELVWDRSPEKDFAAWNVYRNGQKVATGIAVPAYSDRAVSPGAVYRYEITALDTAGNESARSASAEAAIP